jgi:hypothetical protein
MNDAPDIVELATELAGIASATSDPETARRLMVVVERLLAAAGLPREEEGGGEVPTGWLAEPLYEPA